MYSACTATQHREPPTYLVRPTYLPGRPRARPQCTEQPVLEERLQRGATQPQAASRRQRGTSRQRYYYHVHDATKRKAAKMNVYGREEPTLVNRSLRQREHTSPLSFPFIYSLRTRHGSGGAACAA